MHCKCFTFQPTHPTPRSNPYPFIVHFERRGILVLYLLLKKIVPVTSLLKNTVTAATGLSYE